MESENQLADIKFANSSKKKNSSWKLFNQY
jgi:hypothetical protein